MSGASFLCFHFSPQSSGEGGAGGDARQTDTFIRFIRHPTVEEALLDTENSVRIEAVLALGENNGPNSLARILEAICRENSTWQFNYVAVPITIKKIREAGKTTPAEVEAVLSKLKAPQPNHRRMAILVLQDLGKS